MTLQGISTHVFKILNERTFYTTRAKEVSACTVASMMPMTLQIAQAFLISENLSMHDADIGLKAMRTFLSNEARESQRIPSRSLAGELARLK